MTALIPEPLSANFMREYFRGTKGRTYIDAIRNRNSKLGSGEIDKLVTRKSSAIVEFVSKNDKPKQDCAIYFCTSTLKDGATNRDADSCWEFPSLFADVDDKAHDLTRAEAVERLEALECPPTTIVDSGHGLQPHWMLSESSEDAERVIAARKKLHALVASDKVHDAPRIMRLPGSHNSKEGDWLPVEIVRHHPERRYALEVLEDWLDHAEVVIPRKPKAKTNGAANGTPFVLPPSKPGVGTDHKRGGAWARKALEESAIELAHAGGATSRHDTLRDKAIRMGTMIARGWIDIQDVKHSLLAASEACGQFKEYGKGHFEQTFSDGIKFGLARPHADLPDDTKHTPPIGDIPDGHDDAADAKERPDGQRAEAPGGALQTAKASAYTMRGVTWFWPNRFVIGKLGLIGGMPDMGKGLICCDVCACATNKHHPLPCNEGHALQGSVLYFTAEDDIEDTVVPRLAAAGADLDRIHIVKVMGEPNGKVRTFSMITDLPALEAKLDEIGDVMLVIIDPMSAYIGVGKANTSMTSDVRGFLTPLTDLAAKKKVFILGIMHFNKKADVTNAMLRIADSLAYVAAARHVYVVVDDPETEDQRLFVKAKNNISTDKKALSYMTGARNVGTDPDTQKEIWAPHILWGAKHVVITANDAMQADAAGNQSRYARREAKEFLEERLADGPVKQKTIVEDAEANGITKATLRRAKHELKIKSSKEKAANGDWMWELPEPGLNQRRQGDD